MLLRLWACLGLYGCRAEGCSFGFWDIRVHVPPQAPSNSVSTGLRVMSGPALFVFLA